MFPADQRRLVEVLEAEWQCPGDWIVIALMSSAVRFLIREMTYAVPEQHLSVRLNRIPAIPRSRMVLDRVRVAP